MEWMCSGTDVILFVDIFFANESTLLSQPMLHLEQY